MLFSELGLGAEVLRAIEEKGYTQPTPIQEQAIPQILQGRDVLGCAQTGTGKTAGFTLPMIDILHTGRARARMPRSLILEPTRELAAQVSESFEMYGKYNKLSMALLIGGENFADQVKKLDRGVDVLIATPGRLIDLFERGNILLTDIKVLVIDEADRMLDMGFIPDIERIVGLLPRNRQTLFFSATMPPEIRRLADAFLSEPKEISVAPPASPAATVTQALAVVDEMDKRRALRHLLGTEDVKNAFIFCNRKRDIATLQQSLVRHGFNAGALHGDMPQHKRTETLELFKKGEITLLVCSDVAARGLDVQGLSHVFNFDVPINAEDYVHRIGRTGRAGNMGRAFTIAGPEDGHAVAAIGKLIGREVPVILIDGVDSVAFEEGDGRRRGRGGKRDAGRGRGSSRREEGRRDDGRRERDDARRDEGRKAEERPQAREQAEAEAATPRHADRESERRIHVKRDGLRPGGRPDRDDTRREDGRREDGRRDEGRRDDPRRDDGRRGGGRNDDQRGRRRGGGDDDGPPVIGFGDHVPAFIARAGRPKRQLAEPASNGAQAFKAPPPDSIVEPVPVEIPVEELPVIDVTSGDVTDAGGAPDMTVAVEVPVTEEPVSVEVDAADDAITADAPTDDAPVSSEVPSEEGAPAESTPSVIDEAV